MIVGVTGTRAGCTTLQKRLLTQWMPEITELHHGDCIGVDAEAHALALRYEIPIVIHPPTNPTYRAWCEGAILVHPEKPYLVRDHDIVDICELLLGVPKGPEKLRSGTWATIRYARKINRPRSIIHTGGIITND